VSRILLLLSGLALAILAVPAGSSQTGPGPSRETKDRLTPDRMAELVAGPLRAAEAGDLARSERLFERLVESARRRHGSGGVREADLLTAFAIQLYTRGSELPREDMRQLSRAYAERSVQASKRLFGPRHPETALALHSYGHLLFELRSDDPPAEAEAALAEAYSIRQAALGADNAETLSALRTLARIKAARFRTAGKLDEAAGLFRLAIEISARSAPSEEYLKPASLRLDLVRAYVDSGRIDDALREARIAADAAREEGGPEDDPCGFMGGEALAIMADLEVDRPAAAEAFRRLFAPQKDCVKQLIELLEKEAPTPD